MKPSPPSLPKAASTDSPSAEPAADEKAELHVVLVQPDIPWNTGNVGRTCLACDAQLHLVRPLGFRLDAKYLKRAGLDYWQHVRPKVWSSWTELEDQLPELGDPWFFSAEGEGNLWQVDLQPRTVLVFGRETAGLPTSVREKHRERLISLPMAPGPVRSLNLSTSVGIALYEARRRLGFVG